MSVTEEMTLDELLKEIEEKKAPYNRDRVEMAIKGFEYHAEIAAEIRKRLQKEGILEK